MTSDQLIIFTILGAVLVLFVWGRWHFGLVAMLALFACVLTGLVKPEEAFDGFGHPAVITVIAVLAISRALGNSGLIDLIASRLTQVVKKPYSQLTVLCGMATVFSAFMNNVGALALMMPIAISTARQFGYSASQILMPMSYASILGGLSTLVGTPPNIIIATYRRETGESAFGMFDFTPVGLTLALAGVLFIVLIGWRLIPQRRGRTEQHNIFEISDYMTEVRVPEESEVIDKTIAEFESFIEDHVTVVGLIRNGSRVTGAIRQEPLQSDDILLIQGPSSTLEEMVDKAHLELVASEETRQHKHKEESALMEAVVMPRSRVEGLTPATLRLRSYYGVNLLAIARQGRPLRRRLRNVRLEAGDVLLLQGEADTLPQTVASLGCLPLARRVPQFQARRVLLPVVIFGTAIAALVSGLLPAAIAFMGAVIVMVLVGLLPVNEVYESIDWSVVVLLGAMIPVGGALESTGATDVIAASITQLAGDVSLYLILGMIMVVTMTLSDIMNNAATSVVMAPIAISIAQQIGVSPDPFLMAVAVGASSAFLTPIGHQNNTLVMGPGGYRFGDYWRLGLPLEILLVVIGLPLIPVVWPF